MGILYKYGWHALLAAMAGDLIFSLVFPLFYKGYDAMTMSISALGNENSPVRLPFNIWMVIEGLLFLFSIPVIYSCYHSVSKGLTAAAAVIIAAFAVGACVLTGFFSVNESKDVVTTASKIHGAGSVLGFMLFLFMPLLTALLSFRGGDKTVGIIGVLCFIAALLFFVLFVMSDKPAFSDSVIRCEGLWQRLNLFFMYLPLIVIAAKRIAALRP